MERRRPGVRRWRCSPWPCSGGCAARSRRRRLRARPAERSRVRLGETDLARCAGAPALPVRPVDAEGGPACAAAQRSMGRSSSSQSSREDRRLHPAGGREGASSDVAPRRCTRSWRLDRFTDKPALLVRAPSQGKLSSSPLPRPTSRLPSARRRPRTRRRGGRRARQLARRVSALRAPRAELDEMGVGAALSRAPVSSSSRCALRPRRAGGAVELGASSRDPVGSISRGFGGIGRVRATSASRLPSAGDRRCLGGEVVA